MVLWASSCFVSVREPNEVDDMLAVSPNCYAAALSLTSLAFAALHSWVSFVTSWGFYLVSFCSMTSPNSMNRTLNRDSPCLRTVGLVCRNDSLIISTYLLNRYVSGCSTNLVCVWNWFRRLRQDAIRWELPNDVY